MKRQLNAMSLRQLQSLSDVIVNMIETRSLAERKSAAAAEAREIADKHGFTLAELADVPVEESKKGKRGERKPIGKVPFKYQNPNNSSEKWTGRGRSPAWVRDHIEAGGAKDDLLIKAE